MYLIMGRPEKYHIEKKISLEQLDWRIKTKRNTKVQQKLFFVRFRYLGDTIGETALRLGVTKRICYYWQDRWNENGYEGLLQKSGAGRPSKLNNEETVRLKTILGSKDFWTTEEVANLIKEKFEINYSLNAVRKLLKKIGMKNNTPYSLDYRRPENAEEILKNLEEAIKEKVSPDKHYVIGFLDEISPQTAPNTPKLWSFVKKPKIFKNTNRMKANANGFYAMNGKSIIDFTDNSKAEDVCKFLEKIKDENKHDLMIILDNSRTHHSSLTIKKAEQMDSILVFLPSYSPDLNPIEFIWKSIKKEVSKEFIESVTQLRELIEEKFNELSNPKSFAKSWLGIFNKQIKKVVG
jgi:transposase